MDIDLIPPSKKYTADLLALCGAVHDSRARRSLQEWIRTYDLTKAESFQDIAKGYQGVLLLCLHLGHDNKGIRQQCEVMIKCLNGYCQAYERHLALEFPVQVKEQIQKEVRQLVEALAQVVPEPQFRKIRALLDNMGQ